MCFLNDHFVYILKIMVKKQQPTSYFFSTLSVNKPRLFAKREIAHSFRILKYPLDRRNTNIDAALVAV